MSQDFMFDQVEISPLENAIETMESTNRQLQALVDQHDAEQDAQINSLSMVLNGVVDAAVNGGIANFKVWIFTHNTHYDTSLWGYHW